MARLRQGLCLVLTIWMVASRPSATIRSGSPDSRWWGTKESVQIQNSVRDQIRAGNFPKVRSLFEQCKGAAERAGDRVGMVRCLSGEASARMALYDYGGALSIYLNAKLMADDVRDWTDLAAVDTNLSSLYLEIFDSESALEAADEAQAALHRAGYAYFAPQTLLQVGRVHLAAGKEDAEGLFLDGIDAAQFVERNLRNGNVVAVQAQGWDLLGESRLRRNDLSGAEQAYTQALDLRRRAAPRDLGYSFARMGDLREQQAQADLAHQQALLREAEQDTETALQQQFQGAVTLPLYQLRFQRGSIWLAQGRTLEGLTELEGALHLAERWRAGIPRGSSSPDGATVALDERVSGAFVQAAAGYALAHGDSHWAWESFRAAQRDRVLGLKESQALIEIWRRKLPVEFWSTLSQLRAEEASLLRLGMSTSARAEGLRLKLTEMEDRAGLGFSTNDSENFLRSDSLTHFRQRLRDSEILLCFDLEPGGSYLWAVTRRSFRLYGLPAKAQIARQVREFRAAIEGGSSDTPALARRLYQVLLGQLQPAEAAKPEWLLAPDDALFELPFAALMRPDRTAGKQTRPEQGSEGRSGFVYLAEMHSLEVVPGAFQAPEARSPRVPAGGWFLGVGDPIYNTADARWSGTRNADSSGQFNRLPGGGREVEASATVWRSGGGVAVTLEGAQARRQAFERELSRGPAAVHLATHVVTPVEEGGQALVAFGLGEQGQAELMPAADVALLHVPGALVVMTGCGTALGNPRPGVGLQGLTRAWSVAGASAVVATLWHVKDSEEALFPPFYRLLRHSTVAESLRLSQVAMIHSGTALAAPSAWASYELFRGAR